MDVPHLLERLRKLLDSMVEQSEARRSKSYYVASQLIQRLADGDARLQRPSYGREKVVTLRIHLAAIARLTEDDGHPLDQHHCWALGALGSIERELGVA
jgi:hypothetical protein